MPDKFLRNVLLGMRNNFSLPLRSNFKHENNTGSTTQHGAERGQQRIGEYW